VNTLFRQSQNAPPELFEEHESGTSLITAVEAARGVAIVPSVFSCVAGPAPHLARTPARARTIDCWTGLPLSAIKPGSAPVRKNNQRSGGMIST